MLGAITAAAKFLSEPVSRWLTNRKAIQEKRLDVKLADLENQARLLRDTQKANTTWETEQIRQADKFARRFLILALSSPFIVGWFAPERALAYFHFLSQAPTWYTGLFVSVTMAVFGLRKMLQWRDYKRQTTPQGDSTT